MALATQHQQSVQIVDFIMNLFAQRGAREYMGEAVTMSQHMEQSAACAVADGAPDSLVVAALLHDIGHLLHDLPEDAPSHGVDDVHEELGYEWLKERFPPMVAEAVRMHVDAKRYLCAVEGDYAASLSPTSKHSMELQGGSYDDDEVRKFEQRPYAAEGIQLRRWDDRAKIPGLETPAIDHFMTFVKISLDEA